jgi:uncharacterized protein YjbI with pentapeptide repeats
MSIITKSYRNINVQTVIASVILSILAAFAIQAVSAHGGDTSKIHACINTGGLPNVPNIRIVGASDTCGTGETALDWSQNANNGLAFTCPSCVFLSSKVGNRFAGKDLRGAYLVSINADSVNFANTDFTDAVLANAGFSNTDSSGATFTGGNLTSISFTNGTATAANFSSATLTSGYLNYANFTSANFTNTNLTSSDLSFSNFSNANFTGANLTNTYAFSATGMGTATVTGVTWSNTTCPDGTNSDSNGNTCVGHF